MLYFLQPTAWFSPEVKSGSIFKNTPGILPFQEQNPGVGEHRRHIETRLTQGLPDPKLTHFLSGTYHLGISPHIYSYYHLLADLLPHLITSQKFPVLVPEFMPSQFIDFLKEAEFEVQVLSPEIFMVERLLIPEMNIPDWNSEKVKLIQYFFEIVVPLK